jgi:HEAT repeat protein
VQAAGLPCDDAGLLAFLRRRAAAEADPSRLAAAVARLDGDSATAREAGTELLGAGPVAVPLLRQAVRDPDRPGAARARRCLQHLEHNPAALPAAVVRLVAARRPAGAAQALLAYLPCADDEAVLDEVGQALASLAYADGRADPVIVAALDDPLPLRRAMAAAALCRDGPPAPPARLHKLLSDPVPSVRLRAALALAGADDPDGVAALIVLLAELPLGLARQAEDYLAELAGDEAPAVTLGTDDASRCRCRDAWAAWWKAGQGPGVLDELRRRTPMDDKRTQAQRLIARLGDDDFATRERATAGLKALGPGAVPLLRQARRHPDVEVRQRIEACLAELERQLSAPLPAALGRRIAMTRPAGAAEAILAYLPAAEDDAAVADLQRALAAVSSVRGEADAAVVRAVADAVPVRRAAAAEALCRAGASAHYPAVARLLGDPDPAVRLQAAIALAAAGRHDMVRWVIDAVATLPASQSVRAEDYLLQLAHDNPPPGLAEAGGADARKRRDAWAAWWAGNGARVDLAPRRVAAHGGRGCTVLVHPQNGEVVELGPDGRERWRLTGLLGPQDAQVVAGNRVLVAEHNGQRVTERNTRGAVLWQKQTEQTWPVGVQRLRNGHTFIACRDRLVEVDRAGRELYVIRRAGNDVLAARRLAGGQIVCVCSHRRVLWLDTAGKELKSFPVQMIGNMGAVVTSAGHVLVCVPWTGRVMEYDADGTVVWEVGVPQAFTACRLPGGGALVAQQGWPVKVIEVDRGGKAVGEVPTALFTGRVYRR